ncbi:MAG: hypothetical protein H6672_13270 [Anaerolineaceae bacterium]|nr:hypothetical protein [Anaerolineaceae bacterium]
MSKKTAASPFQALEEEAYHAFREWPVWLVLRERELAAHLRPHLSAQRPPGAAGVDQPSAKQRRHPALDEGGK